ncbi:hypothetical protein CcCBS67573_g08220 [Chytriomyces confervae]|uniref:Uncharacterized protein n=1 Tax=Chytriomyces confervae TaxID=246404 RepID=A0A507EP84_9FUNG|nr:hypothetical protein CcCBS67573_g08220 [Chytriomyces confervae]
MRASVVAGISGLYRQFAVMKICAVDFQEDILTVLDMIHSLKKVSAKGQYTNEIAVFQSKLDLLTLLDKTKELSGAALAISDAKALIDELAELDSAQGFPWDIYVALKRDMLAKKAHLKHIFDELYRTAFFYSCENVITFRITVTASAKYHDSPVFLISLIQSMNSAGLLTDYLTAFAESFIKNFIDRTIKMRQARSIRSLYSAKMGMAGNKTISESAPGKTTKTGLEINDISFRLPKCHVSVQAQTLVEQAYQILTEARTMDPETATELFYCARDIFDMYRAVMPFLHEGELLNSPTRAVLFYNDTEYICHHLLTMGYQFQDRLPPAINQFATFLDMVPFLRNMGKSYFRAQMRKQRDIVQMHVSNAQGFSNLTDDARFETVERCIKQALSHLNSLSRVWKPILAEEMYLTTMGLLVDTFLESVMTQVAALEGRLRVEEGHQLRYILGLVLKAEDMFEKRVPGGSGGSTGMRGIGKKGAGWVKMPVRKYVNRWDAFLKVKEDLML